MIPIHPLAAPELKRWKDDGWRALVGRAPTDADPIFPNPKGKAILPRSADLLREDLEAADLPSKFDGQPFEFNDLRHSFSTWLSSAGVPKETRDRLMGHVPQSVGERHYTATDLRLLEAAIARIVLDPKADSRDAKPTNGGSQLSQELSHESGADTDQRQVAIVSPVLGGVAEWSKAAVLKTAVPATVPGVRIPSPPPAFSQENLVHCRHAWLVRRWRVRRRLRNHATADPPRFADRLTTAVANVPFERFPWPARIQRTETACWAG